MGRGNLFRSFKVRSDDEEVRGVESNEKLPHPFIPSKTANMVPKLEVEYLPLGRTAAVMHKLAVKYLPLGRTL